MTSPTTAQLIADLGLIKHPEGGYFVETDRQEHSIPSPFADNALRSLATSIYYLLSHDTPNGVIHMNKSVTYHVVHHGRAEYTLIHPGTPPRIEKKVIGADTSRGESRLLLVGTGVWKMSKLLPEDLERATTDDQKARTSCLITEVVVPGFHWEDHQFLTTEGLISLLKGTDDEARINELSPFLKKL